MTHGASSCGGTDGCCSRSCCPNSKPAAGAERSESVSPDETDLARFMFTRNASDYTDDGDLIAEMWDNPGVRDFWIAEARSVLDYLEGR